MKTTEHASTYFYGHEVSEYGRKRGYLDYRTLSQAFEGVLVNDITKLFYADVAGEYNEPEQVNGIIDNSEEISELQDQIYDMALLANEANDYTLTEEQQAKMDELQNKLDELDEEQNEQSEIFQYFIISDNGAEILKEFTNDPVYYIPVLDCYVWGVTHLGTSWDYVLTNVKLNISED